MVTPAQRRAVVTNLWVELWVAAPGFLCTSLTQQDEPESVRAPYSYHLGNRPTGKETSRGTLQTSALPLGYGAGRVKPGEMTPLSQPTPIMRSLEQSYCWRAGPSW